ncbi:MAG TPA: L-glyceraldehyde 3-phosphate reductase [Candidatus Agrococcus pullicola]|uniref:L-glyceraldehyde 3-phosphate reductase n=1 Tax=Candidatus Agrococcus pullicola TaxID=2838429 RepID=A0A9D1YVL3_9MICO|nr:L-glyceraldehyde 3-phosphate reductase [Candidatus Agrococcus pullicola]
MTWQPSPERFAKMDFRRSGNSGLKLSPITLGLWQNFGEHAPLERQRELVRSAVDLGITHFDLANNYGPPSGSAERHFGRMLATDLAGHRDDLVIATKAGWRMDPGPYQFGGSRKYLISSLDASLQRLGLDYVDIYYHHRPDPETPLEESMRALHDIVRSGKALYVGISSYSAADTRRAHEILADLGTPLTIHQPSYSMLNRWIETDGLVDTCGELGIGMIGFTPLAQGLLTGKYLNGVPEGSRAARSGSTVNPVTVEKSVTALRALNDIADSRGQSLAQMALAWALRDARMTSLTLGASRVEQLEHNVAALENLEFSEEELTRIDKHAEDVQGVDGNWGAARKSTQEH